MREGRARVCVATDVAARGIDLPGLDLVLHADLPRSAEVLLHRSGRTGRAGRAGLAVLIVSDAERRRGRLLARRAGVTIKWVAAPGQAEVRGEDLERLLGEPALFAPPGPEDAAAAAELMAAHAPEAVAAALLRFWRAGRPAAETLARR
jgi:ATP-dependent RNA helicase DeaD